MHGQPKYAADFRHLEYVNPAAPKGGTLRLGALGTFDNLNPYVSHGVTPPGRQYVFESLLKRTDDEPFSLYGLIARSIEIATDRSWIRFRLRPEARFHDGTAITAADVVYSYNTLRAHGRPNHRIYYKQIARVTTAGIDDVTFHFGAAPDREMPLIMGLMPILSEKYYRRVKFDRTTLIPPMASGPYRIDRVEPGRRIIYRRDPNYWGRHLPINRGQHNFEIVRYDFFRDANILFEAFKSGEIDFRHELSPSRWANGYDFPARTSGKVKMEIIRHDRPAGMRAIVFNTRRPLFADRRVRKALAYAFDFNWLNKNLFHGAYTRSTSYFANSDLASVGQPGPDELALLERFRGGIPGEVFGGAYRPPATDGTGAIRGNLRKAVALLKDAGWVVRDGKMVRRSDHRHLKFEMLLARPSNERIALAFARNLKRIGIEMRVRTVDTAQYQSRVQDFDFDVAIKFWHQSLSPGNEQRYYWGSQAAALTGSGNLPGIQDPAVDYLADIISRSPDRRRLRAATRALDRVLSWGHYVIPLFHLTSDRIAYWEKFARPRVTPPTGYAIESWWVDPAKAKAVER